MYENLSSESKFTRTTSVKRSSPTESTPSSYKDQKRRKTQLIDLSSCTTSKVPEVYSFFIIVIHIKNLLLSHGIKIFKKYLSNLYI